MPNSPFKKLDSIPNENMAELFAKEFTVVPNWLPENASLWLARDLQTLEMNNVLEDQTSDGPNPVRTDQSLWIHGAMLPTAENERLRGIEYLLQKLTSLPFELNAKTRLQLTVSS